MTQSRRMPLSMNSIRPSFVFNSLVTCLFHHAHPLPLFFCVRCKTAIHPLLQSGITITASVSTTPVHIPALLLVVEGIVGRIKSSPLLFVCLCVRSLYLSSTLVLVPSPTSSKPTPTFANPLSATSLFAPSLFLPEGNALLFP